MSKRKILTTFFILPLILNFGCNNSQTKRSEATANAPAKEAAAQTQTPEASIYVDEAMLAKPYAIIGGTVENTSGKPLERLSVEIELRKREDGSLVRHEAAVAPADLAPGARGKFSLKVLSDEWGGSRVAALRSGARPDEVAFKTLPGAKRAPERIPDRVTVVKSPRQKSKSKGEEFLNTPDDPVKVP